MIEDTLFKILHELEKLNALLSPKDAPQNGLVVTSHTPLVTDAHIAQNQVTGVAKQAPAPTREEVGKKLIELATKKNRAAAETVLQKFGAAKLDGVAGEQYPAFYAAIVAELG